MKTVAVVFVALVLFVGLASLAQAQTTLTKCTTAADCYKAGSSYCTCNGAEKPYCLDGEDWRVNYYHCSKGVTSTDLEGYYCVKSSSTSSQPTQYICDNGKSVNNNGYENGVWAGPGVDSCLDGKDNDYDGSIDCSDSDCAQATSCLTCESGQLKVGQCSLTQRGLYCQSRNNLVDRCSSCGCADLYYCSSNDKCVRDNPPTIVASITPSSNFAGLTFTLNATISDDRGISSASWKGDKIFKDGLVIGCAGTSCSYSTPISTYISGTHTITINAIDNIGQKTEKTLTMTVNSCLSNSNCGTDEWFGDTFCGIYNNTNFIYQYHRVARCNSGGCETGTGTDPKIPCQQGFICQHKTNIPGSTPKDAECVLQPTPTQTSSPTPIPTQSPTQSPTPTISTQPTVICAYNSPITSKCECSGSNFSTGYCCSAADSTGRQSIYQSSVPCSIQPPVVPPVIVNPPNTRATCDIDADNDGNKCDLNLGESEVSCSSDCGVSSGYANGCGIEAGGYCGDGSCNRNCNVQEDYWNCHLDCPKPSTSPTQQPERPTVTAQPSERPTPPREPLRCGTIAGLTCPSNYRCDYGGRSSLPYPDAGGLCIFEPVRERPQGNQTTNSCNSDSQCGWYSANGCPEGGALWRCGTTGSRNVLSEIASNQQCSSVPVSKPTQSCGCVQNSCAAFEGQKPVFSPRPTGGPVSANQTESVIAPEKLLGLVIDIEQLKVRFDYLAKRMQQLANYYTSINNSASSETWSEASSILTAEISNIEALKSKIKQNVENFTKPLLQSAKSDLAKVVGALDRVLDVALRGA
ncbi:MAG: hypothetical protein HY512_02365 [Candidatus Aenigmarchaeota archaeon]|nr:hypothetical protein [Candidatus Aenigmarchaeota archaeon]